MLQFSIEFVGIDGDDDWFIRRRDAKISINLFSFFLFFFFCSKFYYVSVSVFPFFICDRNRSTAYNRQCVAILLFHFLPSETYAKDYRGRTTHWA